MASIPLTSAMELGLLYSRVCDFDKALDSLQHEMKASREKGNWKTYFEAVTAMVRIWAERLNFDKIAALTTEISELRENSEITVPAKFHYAMGICYSYQEQWPLALQHFSNAKDLAPQNSSDYAHSSFGLAAYYLNSENFEECEHLLNEVRLLCMDLHLNELEISCLLLEAVLFRRLKQYSRALSSLQGAQARVGQKMNVYMILNVLFSYGAIYLESSRFDLARQYLTLANNLVDNNNLKHLASSIRLRMNQLPTPDAADLILVSGSEVALIEKTKGVIPLHNQHLLWNLLNYFIQSAGSTLSKEDLVRHLWKESYSQATHDNKLYVTIQRLRKLIEVNQKKPHYIVKRLGGYTFNKNVRVEYRQSS